MLRILSGAVIKTKGKFRIKMLFQIAFKSLFANSGYFGLETSVLMLLYNTFHWNEKFCAAKISGKKKKLINPSCVQL
jgi:hypothetical protein